MKKRIIQKKEKKQIIILFALIFTILIISFVSADSQNACLKKGEKIRFSKCNPGIDDYTCPTTSCTLCVNEISEGIYCPSNSCGPLGSGGCSDLGNATFDVDPPNITVNTPIESQFYDSRSLLLDIELDEKSDLYYLDNIYGRDRWRILCRDCSDYNRKKSMKEGPNNLTFKAIDRAGNNAYLTRTFIIDSSAPRIHKTEPRSGYASGLFEVQYSEDNLVRVELFYGNAEMGFRNATLTNCSSGKKQWCSTDVDLSDYNAKRIEYYFEIEDIARSVKKSQMRKNLPVDTVYPIFNNPTTFWQQGTGRYSRYVYFTFDVTEENLNKITYSYLDSRNKTRETRLCSRLRDNICEIKKSFSRGDYDINIQITDRAGNAVGTSLQFSVDY